MWLQCKSICACEKCLIISCYANLLANMIMSMPTGSPSRFHVCTGSPSTGHLIEGRFKNLLSKNYCSSLQQPACRQLISFVYCKKRCLQKKHSFDNLKQQVTCRSHKPNWAQPYSSTCMLDWNSQGCFNDGVWVRKVGEDVL